MGDELLRYYHGGKLNFGFTVGFAIKNESDGYGTLLTYNRKYSVYYVLAATPVMSLTNRSHVRGARGYV